MSSIELSHPGTAPRALQVVADYLSLTKPRIVLLLVLTAVAAMFPAAHGWPHPVKLFAVILGGSLASGGAKAINAWFDRDIDAEMRRTRRRPLPDARMPAWHALALGVAMNVAAVGVLWFWTNTLAAALALTGTLIYVFVYTIWLKRSTPQNIVIGGAAGAIPPLVGWAAVTGDLNLTAVSLFLVVFFWTPPHFWALAQMIHSDYERAHVPMLPVVAGAAAAKKRIVVYATLVVLASLVPFFTGAVGALYLTGALILGVGLISLAILDLTRTRWTMRLWAFSMAYLAALFGLLAVAAFGIQ